VANKVSVVFTDVLTYLKCCLMLLKLMESAVLVVGKLNVKRHCG